MSDGGGVEVGVAIVEFVPRLVDDLECIAGTKGC